MSQPQHYSGPELGALLAQVRSELGEDATIHEANKVRSGGIGGFFAKESFEISASPDAEDRRFDSEGFELVEDTPMSTTALGSHALGSTALDGADPDSDVILPSSSADADRLEPLDTIGDLAHTHSSSSSNLVDHKRPSIPIGSTPMPATSTASKSTSLRAASSSPTQDSQSGLPMAPPRRTLLSNSDGAGDGPPAITFDFDRLNTATEAEGANTAETGADTLLDGHQAVVPTASRTPISTANQRGVGDISSANSLIGAHPGSSVGEVVADALMQRAELVNALEHLESTDQVIASQLSDADRFSNVSLELDPSFREVLDATLGDPYFEHGDPAEDLAELSGRTEAEDEQAVQLDRALEESDASLRSEVFAPAAPSIPQAPALSEAALSEAEHLVVATTSSAPPERIHLEEIEQPNADLVEPAGNRERPDFWTRMTLAREEVSLYRLPNSNVTAIVGPLDLSLPVARTTQQEHWIGVEDLAVLSTRESVASVPSWQTVARVDDLYWAMNEWRETQRRGLVVVDTTDLEPAKLTRLITQLRSKGADLIRVTLPLDVNLDAFTDMVSELGGPIAVDLPAGTSPSDILGALDKGLIVASVAGLALTAELLVALRNEVAN